MRTLHRRSPLKAITASQKARDIIDPLIPGLLESKKVSDLAELPAGWALEVILGKDDERLQQLFDQIEGIADPRPPLPTAEVIEPSTSYEPDEVQLASAEVSFSNTGEVNRPIEIVFSGPSHGNPFVDVDLFAEFTSENNKIKVGGFYDGAGRYVIRFLPPAAGQWQFRTTSTARSLSGHEGIVDVIPGDARGPVKVADQFHFEYADGTPFAPVGTTAYAWIHQSEELMDQTVTSLKDAPFNKIRMCVFPKHYIYNSNEPDYFVWERGSDGVFDFTRFDVEFWRRLEQRLRQLDELGIQADLILFHPYDHWGFANLPAAVDDRYLRYITRRLSAFPNVWWSLANEYDLLLDKTVADWNRYAALIGEEDYANHLLSIHNWLEPWDFSSPWATHCSVQRGDQLEVIDQWRKQWNKPVVMDEIGYEGDLDQGWGNLTSGEFVDRFWQIMLRGGFATHGETFWEPDDVIWWSKGGILHGDSPARIQFLESIREAAPTKQINPLPSDWDAMSGGIAGEYELIYFGNHRPKFRDVSIPSGMSAKIDVIDAWNMTITPVPGVHTGMAHVDLPARPYQVIRLRRA